MVSVSYYLCIDIYYLPPFQETRRLMLRALEPCLSHWRVTHALTTNDNSSRPKRPHRGNITRHSFSYLLAPLMHATCGLRTSSCYKYVVETRGGPIPCLLYCQLPASKWTNARTAGIGLTVSPWCTAWCRIRSDMSYKAYDSSWGRSSCKLDP